MNGELRIHDSQENQDFTSLIIGDMITTLPRKSIKFLTLFQPTFDIQNF